MTSVGLVESDSMEMDPKEFHHMKQQAMQYYKENAVPDKMEEILNSMFYEKPKDVFGHLANYFESMAITPKISKLQTLEVFDSNGQQAVQTDVYCSVKNMEKCLGNSFVSHKNNKTDHQGQERDLEDIERCASVQAAVEYINGDLSDALSGLDPTKQEDIDAAVFEIINKLHLTKKEEDSKNMPEEKTESQDNAGKNDRGSASKRKSAQGKGKKGTAPSIIHPDEPVEKLLKGCQAVSSVSEAVCKAGACVRDTPLYQHIGFLKSGEVATEIKIPLPMVTIIAGGRSSFGKLKAVKEFMIFPRNDMECKESLKHISDIYNHVVKALISKAGPKASAIAASLVTETGALFPTLDKIEQGLDLIQDAITAVGLAPGKDFFIALDLAAHEIFDYDKGKYEVLVGAQKAPEELADFYSELLGRYPSVIALIDPTRKADKDSWMKVCEKISDKCLIIGDEVYHRPELLNDEEITEHFLTSAIILRFQEMSTVTAIIKAGKKMEDLENTVLLSTNAADTTDTFIVDMAVGMGCRYLKIGAPCRGERTVKFNRLLQIESRCKEEGILKQWEKQTFPKITAPPPTPVDETDSNQSDKKSDSKKK